MVLFQNQGLTPCEAVLTRAEQNALIMTSMKTSPSPKTRLLAAVCVFAAALLAGCSTTTMKLGGTPGASFSGHYVLGTTAHDLFGATPWIIEVPPDALTECEVRKADPKSTLTLTVTRGFRTKLKARAEPGALGIRARNNQGWSYKVLR